MSNLVIVAIPDENDPVWKVSSEKVPHLTILFLGDMGQISNLSKIVDFVEHAATTTLNRFYMTVDRRDELGADKADVLFFKKNYDYKAVRNFRAALLKDNNIRKAYDSASQFEGPWKPHLTLGYPTAPAKDDEIDHPLWSVDFNKIAVWTGDFEGTEFLLKDYWDEYETLDNIPMDVAMSAILKEGHMAHQSVLDNPTLASQIRAKLQSILDDVTGDADKDLSLFGDPLIRTKIQSVLQDFYNNPNVDKALVYDALGAEFLEHYGVKGMKWGVRRQDRPAEKRHSMWDPEGHDVGIDAFRAIVWPMLPPLGLFSIPAHVRLARGAARGIKAKTDDVRDKRFAQKVNSATTWMHTYNKAADGVNAELPEFNASFDRKYGKAKMDSGILHNPNHEITKEYTAGHQALLTKHLNKAANDLGTNSSGTKRVAIKITGKGAHEFGWDLELKDVKHAADALDANDVSEFTFKTDASGRITKLAEMAIELGMPIENEMVQTATLGAEFLVHAGLMTNVDFMLHYGTKGMKWGVRKETPSAVTPRATSHVPHGTKSKTRVNTEGGENHPAHDDALKVAESKAKLARSGTAALSNRELREVAQRIQLEQQVKELTAPAGRRWVKGFLKRQGEQSVGRVVARKAMARGL